MTASFAFALVAIGLNLTLVAWRCIRHRRITGCDRPAGEMFRAVFRLRRSALSDRDLPDDAWGRQVARLRLHVFLSNMAIVWGAIFIFVLFDFRPR